jgi:hypothetical protein
MQYTDVQLNHSIKWRPMTCGDGKWNDVRLSLPHGTKHRYRLDDLPYANQKYEIAVQAIPKNASFDDLWSDPAVVIGRTASMPPETPVMHEGSYEHVHSTADNTRALYIYWAKPDVCLQNGDNFRHRVEVYSTKSLEKPVADVYVNATKSFAEFRDLRADEEYHVRVTAVNNAGVSPDSGKITVFPQKKIPYVPYSVSSILFTGGVYEVSWKPSKYAPDASSYTVFYCEQDSPAPNRCDGTIGWRNVDAHTTRVNLTDLNQKKPYQFAVATNTDVASSGKF